MEIPRILRKLMGCRPADNGHDDLGKAEALAAQQKVFDLDEYVKESTEEFETKMFKIEKRMSDTDVQRKKEDEDGRIDKDLQVEQGDRGDHSDPGHSGGKRLGLGR